MEMSIRASSPCGVRALSRRGENALYGARLRFGRLRQSADGGEQH
jgi:hypothetical protein